MNLFIEVCRYPKDGEFLDSSVDVTSVGVDVLADLAGFPAAEWVGCVPLTKDHAERVRELTGITLDLETYDYFLEPSAG